MKSKNKNQNTHIRFDDNGNIDNDNIPLNTNIDELNSDDEDDADDADDDDEDEYIEDENEDGYKPPKNFTNIAKIINKEKNPIDNRTKYLNVNLEKLKERNADQNKLFNIAFTNTMI